MENKIKKIRLSLGLTQEQLAKKCGFQTSAISHFENGRREPSLASLVKLSKKLGVSIDSLVFGKNIELEKYVKSMNQLITIQCSDGNWNYDEYMRGMANGMLVLKSVFDGKECVFFEPPKKYLKDIKLPKNFKPKFIDIQKTELIDAYKNGKWNED